MTPTPFILSVRAGNGGNLPFRGRRQRRHGNRFLTDGQALSVWECRRTMSKDSDYVWVNNWQHTPDTTQGSETYFFLLNHKTVTEIMCWLMGIMYKYINMKVRENLLQWEQHRKLLHSLQAFSLVFFSEGPHGFRSITFTVASSIFASILEHNYFQSTGICTTVDWWN